MLQGEAKILKKKKKKERKKTKPHLSEVRRPCARGRFSHEPLMQPA